MSQVSDIQPDQMKPRLLEEVIEETITERKQGTKADRANSNKLTEIDESIINLLGMSSRSKVSEVLIFEE